MISLPTLLLVTLAVTKCSSQSLERRVGKFHEVFAWRQLTYEINGYPVIQDRQAGGDLDDTGSRNKRQSDNIFFNQPKPGTNSNRPNQNQQNGRPGRPMGWPGSSNGGSNQSNTRPTFTSTSTTTTTAAPNQNPTDESGRFFIQYNNVPMGAERVGNRLFITVPRRRYGIPSTLNYIDLTQHRNTRSPPLTPYPNMRLGRTLTSVYRTKADACNRLWMVDTGMLEIPDNGQQLQPPAIVIFDLKTDTQILRYPFKSSDLVSENTPAGLASITLDVDPNNCAAAFAYIPDLATYGLIVFSLRDRDSWRLRHNYFNFNPLAGNLNIAGQRFQWSDGIFSMTLSPRGSDGCSLAYFHPLISTQEFTVSTCVLRNRTAASDTNLWTNFNYLGERGENRQSTIHAHHDATRVIFYAEVARSAISCWNSRSLLRPTQMAILAQDTRKMMYPSDLHVTNDEVWVMANSMPRFIYSSLDTNEYNFYVYRGTVQELIAGTTCANDLQLTFKE